MLKLKICRVKLYLSLCFLFISPVVFSQIQADLNLLKEHVYILASDSLQGRGTGAIGQKKAAKYISGAFARYGLKPWGDEYYDRFDIVQKHRNKATLKQGDNLIFTPWHFFYVSNYNHKDTLNQPLRFVGFGSWDEIGNANLTDKSVVLLADSPSRAYDKIKAIQDKFNSQSFFVIFPDPNNKVDMVWRKEFEDQKINLRSAYEADLAFRVKEPWVTLEGLDSVNIFYCFENALEKVYNKTDDELFELANSNKNSTEDLLAVMDPLPMRCVVNYYDTLQVTETENISGFIQGIDTSKTIVLTAHYDHIGIVNGEINYGADDNASGTAVLLEVARLLSAGEKPAYNVQFIAFSGEELGLLGSSEYVEHPFVPLESTLVNINMDMVGRWDVKHESNRDFVYLLANGEHSIDWVKQAKLEAKALPISISKKPGAHEKKVFTYGSDHFSFYQKNVPVLVVFTGLHDDYHTPRDVPEKINYTNLTNISTLIARLIYKGGKK